MFEDLALNLRQSPMAVRVTRTAVEGWGGAQFSRYEWVCVVGQWVRAPVTR